MGFAAAAPFFAGTAAGGSVGGALGAGAGMGLGALTANPLLMMILGQAGGNLLGNLFGGGQSPFEQNVQQRLGITQQLIPQLQAQAGGQPTAATQAAGRQLSAAVNRLQQSYGASAQRAGMAGTTPARAQQGRFQAARVEGLANIMGQSQLAAQQQLTQLATGAPGQQFLIEQQRRQTRGQFLGDIGQIFAEIRTQGGEEALDADTADLYRRIIALISSF